MKRYLNLTIGLELIMLVLGFVMIMSSCSSNDDEREVTITHQDLALVQRQIASHANIIIRVINQSDSIYSDLDGNSLRVGVEYLRQNGILEQIWLDSSRPNYIMAMSGSPTGTAKWIEYPSMPIRDGNNQKNCFIDVEILYLDKIQFNVYKKITIEFYK